MGSHRPALVAGLCGLAAAGVGAASAAARSWDTNPPVPTTTVTATDTVTAPAPDKPPPITTAAPDRASQNPTPTVPRAPTHKTIPPPAAVHQTARQAARVQPKLARPLAVQSTPTVVPTAVTSQKHSIRRRPRHVRHVRHVRQVKVPTVAPLRTVPNREFSLAAAQPVGSAGPPVPAAPPTRDAFKLGLGVLGALGVVLLGIAAVPAGRLPQPRLMYLSFGVRPVFALAGLWLISAVAIIYLVLRFGA